MKLSKGKEDETMDKNKMDELFKKLTADRNELANALEKPAVRGYKDSVIDKYSDQAHFIYELLQNADDVGASKVQFKLDKDNLLFIHNGKRNFSVSDPDNEEIDRKKGLLGDLNAITSIGQSSKTGNSAKIGKFGVGFKAVFQYTETPIIYDPNFNFKIERMIVPIRVEDAFPQRKSDETYFFFPFNKTTVTTKEAYDDISGKLCALIMPMIFLNTLKKIEFSSLTDSGIYEEIIEKEYDFDTIIIKRIKYIFTHNEHTNEQRMLLCQRIVKNEYTISVVYFLDENDELCSKKYDAFCFFPTKVNTNLPFAIHAPFLLTDSREGIRAGKQHNIDMIQELAKLAADSLVAIRNIGIDEKRFYINENVLNIIPYEKTKFSEHNQRDTISFMPFYNLIKSKFKTSKLFLIDNNEYIGQSHGYWAGKISFMRFFGTKQLQDITGDEKAHWVFPNLGINTHKAYSSEVCDYIMDVVAEYFSDETLLKRIDKEFTEKQPLEWLFQLYRYFMSNKNLLKMSETLPVLLDQNKKAVAAYEDGKINIFLGSEGLKNDRYTTVYDDIVKNDDGKEYVMKMDIHEPSLKDEIYEHILPEYEENKDIDPRRHWKYFLKFYKKASYREVNELITRLLDCRFVFSEDKQGNIKSYFPSQVYRKNDVIEKYFYDFDDVYYYDYDAIKKIAIETNTLDVLDGFLRELNLETALPKIVDYTCSLDEAIKKKLPNYNNKNISNKEANPSWVEKRIDHMQENLKILEENKDINRALFLWDILVKVFDENLSFANPEKVLKGLASYKNPYYGEFSKTKQYVSSDVEILRTSKWLIDYKSDFVAPYEVTIQELDSRYDVNDYNASQVLKFLGVEEESTENLSNRQKEKLQFMNELLATIGKDKLEKLLKEEERKKINNTDGVSNEIAADTPSNGYLSMKNENEDLEDNIYGIMKEIGSIAAQKLKDDVSKNKIYAQCRDTEVTNDGYDEDEIEINYPDEDEYLRASVDYKKKIESAKDKAAKEINLIEKIELLQKRAESADKYSYDWFLALLDLELLASNKNDSNNHEISIKFGKIKKVKDTDRTVLLSNPDKYIPLFMEELSNIELKMLLRNGTNHKVIIEAMSVKDYTLKVKLRSSDEIDGVDLDDVKECNIKAISPSFLLEALIDEFNKLGFELDDNLQTKLPSNIKFIFGPPGTGKTTYLATNELIPLMDEKRNRILVLTPTNKAADVIARRIMEVCESDELWKEWLIRFGNTNDEQLEKEGVYKDKQLAIESYKKCIVITTIIRFPYDFFILDNDKRLFLNNIDWDYIVVDEASMIPLVNIIYLLYKAKPQKFIISGDPFQIEPITAVDLWKDENIYSIVQLKSFINPNTIPHAYEVYNLNTQYRSVPCIGRIFSNFAYDGVLQHNRVEENTRKLNIDSVINIRNLNVIKFPVSRYEGIYRAKRLINSPYQIYVGLFVVEFSKFLAKIISEHNPQEKFSIGVIAPYRAEANLIDKLLVQMDIPESVDVQAGTIHGFQGDECDIIICVFNPPPHISNDPQMFLNKINIINVAISRARDYLIIVMPDNNTSNISNLYRVLSVEKMFKSDPDHYKEFSASELENLMFGRSDYIELNTFNTNHQVVNVYGLPEYYYEVRSEENALDVQVHKEAIRIESTSDDSLISPAKEDIIQTDVDEYFEIAIDPENEVDDDGWNCREISWLIKSTSALHDSNADVEQMVYDIAEKLKKDNEAHGGKVYEADKFDIMIVGFKFSVFSRMAKGDSAEEAGASALEEKMWNMYKNNYNMFCKLFPE